jgi:CHAD domain-containing protein
MKRDDRTVSTEVTRRNASSHLFHLCIGQLSMAAEAWRVRPDETQLHEFRNALRSVRVLLRVFGDEADAHGGKSLRLALTRAADKLGAVRDLDVMLELIRRSEFQRSGRNMFEIGLLVSAIRQTQAKRFAIVQAFMASGSWTRAEQLAQRFLHRFDAEVKPSDRELITAFLDREFQRHGRKILRKSKAAKSLDAEVLHDFRINLRRLRYLGDLLGDIASPKQRKVFKRVHACEQDLGRVHDLDLALGFLRDHPAKSPLRLQQEWQTLRNARIKRFRKKWSNCREKRF